MLNKTKLKQGTLAWEKARENRIGSSEVFDIVRYYASDSELQNCGINPEKMLEEKPYTTAWALFHKMKNDGIYTRQEIPPELAIYGHAVEPYGVQHLQQGRTGKLKAGDVYVSDRLIASLDISGTSEEIDGQATFYGSSNKVPVGKWFVCEQKTMMPSVVKNGLPLKYILQAQYQIMCTGMDFYILQLMILDNDTAFERGKITQMSPKKKREYLDKNMRVSYYYFDDNPHLSALIQTCLDRFFKDMDDGNEPTPFIAYDSQKNILESIRLNTFYNAETVINYELDEYVKAKATADLAESARKAVLQKIIEKAKEENATKFISSDGTTASFSASGAFLPKPPKKSDVAAKFLNTEVTEF